MAPPDKTNCSLVAFIIQIIYLEDRRRWPGMEENYLPELE